MAILKYLGLCLCAARAAQPCLESPEDDWRCAVRYSDDDCTPDSDDECGDEDRRI